MNVLIACEYSATVRDAFNARGHNAWSCDLLPTTGRYANHLQGDVRWALEGRLDKFDAVDMRTGRKPMFLKWDMMLAFPPCTYLTSAGLHWNKRRPERAALTKQALDFVQMLFEADIEKTGLENPIGCISTQILQPSQIIQPWQFGEDASKATCLWLKGLPLLVPTKRFQGRMVICNGKMVERWGNQTDSGQNRLGPSEDRAMIRGKTYQGIADAMARQWG